MKRIFPITCSICGWCYEVDLDKVEGGKLTPAEPVTIIEKHLKDIHGAEPITGMRRKPRLIN